MDDLATGAPQPAPAGDDGSLPGLVSRLARELVETRSALDLLQATLEITQDGVIATGFYGRTLHFNARFVQIWGIPPHKAAALNDAALLALQLTRVTDPARFLDFAQARHARPSQELCETFELTDGRFVECRVLPQRVRGRRTGSVTCCREVPRPARPPAAVAAEVQARSRTTAIPCPTPMHIVHSA